jgi:GNAT superfamily N-acetyltransferase
VSQVEYPLIDLALSRRLERTEGHANARFVESRARVAPEVGARWMEAGGAYAMFDGVGSPLTQTFGLGMFSPADTAAFEAIEGFFESRGSDVFHEVSPLADSSTLTMLNERGYRPCELTSVLFQPLPTVSPSYRATPPFTVKLASVEERDTWAATALTGWSEFAEVREFMSSFGPTAAGADDAYPFLAWLDDVPVATGSLSIHEHVALLAGASTIPAARGRGAQHALLEARLSFAAAQGCTLAMMCAAPGGSSQRNAERRGFRVAYTRIKWHRALR